MKLYFYLLVLLKVTLLFDPTNLTTKQIYHFYNNSEEEKLRNLNLANQEVKELEEQYVNCVTDLRDVNFTKDEIDSCLGKDFDKIT
jgi:hypothetical protein